jgi:uncharacterized protein (UPF0264 family)
MTGLLASVVSLAEARMVAANVDIIDLKEPRAGALGALPLPAVREIVAELGGGRQPISATIGDMPMHPARVLAAAREMAATGVDYVKIGFFPRGDWAGTIDALAPLSTEGIGLVAVLFGDQQADLHWLARLAQAGFSGAMLDTMDKSQGSLCAICSLDYLRDFVAQVQSHGLLSGLAGSLRCTDVPPLVALSPDYLGFRGALCHGLQRTAGLDVTALQNIRVMLT